MGPRSWISRLPSLAAGKIRIGDHELVAVPHAREHMKQIGVQQWMDALEHFVTLP